MDAGKNSGSGKRKPSRRLPYQTERLIAFFEECTKPNISQRAELAAELDMEISQVTNWFQNRRNTTKAMKDHQYNTNLQEENDHMRYENESLSEMLNNLLCLKCDPNASIRKEDRKLKKENFELKEEIEKASNELTKKTRKPIRDLLSMSPESIEELQRKLAGNSVDWQSGGPTIQEIDLSNSQSRPKEAIVEQALLVKNEFVTLVLDESLWFRSPTSGAGYILHLENYYHKFPKSRHLRTSSSLIETSRNSLTVPIAAPNLFEMFMDTNRWADLFPTIVTEAWNVETLNSASHGEAILHLMNVRMHILSPLVAPREFYFFRYGCQADQSIWVIVDSSSDYFINIQDETAPTCGWKFPSGVVIQSLDHGKASLVTWIEHVEVNKSLNHPLVRNLLSTMHGYGATRWLSSLERMCERSLYSEKHSTATFDHAMQGGVLGAPEARRSFLNLTHRMIKDLCAIVSLPSISDLLEPTNGMVRMSVRTNNELPSQPLGEIVSLSTSVRLPLTFETIFDFLSDISRRHAWDAMLGPNPMNEMTRLATGGHPGNYVSYMQPTMFKDGQVWWIQENSLDRLGALVVFAPIHPSVMNSVSKGEDMSMEPILPCGFLISGDQSVANGEIFSDGASTSSGSGSRPSGSLLTLTYQTLVCSNQSKAVNYLNTVISNTIQNLRLIFGCPELDY